MYLQIEDPSQIPLPPEEVRLRSVDLQPYSDGRRIRMILALTPFQSPPNIAVIVHDTREQEVSSLSVIGATETQMSLTIHLRCAETEGPLRVGVQVRYDEIGVVDQRDERLELSGDDQHG